MSTSNAFDLVIVGGGLAGASLAVALRQSGLTIAVVERWAWGHAQQPSYDERTVALTWSSRCIYTGMGVWSSIAAEAEPIRDIHVSDRGGFGMTHLSHRHAGTAALGYVVPTRSLGRILHTTLAASDGITLFCPAQAEKTEASGSRRYLAVTQGEKTVRISAPLVVMAEGGRSGLMAGGQDDSKPYRQQALLSVVTTDQLHQGRAWERFTREGPLALLPLSQNRLAVVWTSMPEALTQRLAMQDDTFIHHLQRTFGDRAGNLRDPSVRQSYRLYRHYFGPPAQDRRVVLANAAQIVHPVAGQGFNLGLRDIAVLAELIFHACLKGQDLGSEPLLSQYNRLRRRDSFMVRQFTHSLVALFTSDLPGVSLVRNLGLKSVEWLPPAKRFLLRRTMGLANTSSQLIRGLPLENPITGHTTNASG